MRIKNHKDFWSGVMFVGLGLAFALGALGYAFGRSARPGPGYFPFGLGLLTSVLGGALMLNALMVDAPDDGRIGAWAWRPMAIVVASLVVFGLALPRLGLLLALPLLVLGVSSASTEFRWRDALLNAAVLTVGSYLVFVLGLGLTLPVGPSVFGA